MHIKRVCVFCGSRPGQRPEYMAAAETLGRLAAERGIGVVYGGASVGTMGRVADAAMAAGGEVIGVIPTALVDRELAHTGLSELRQVSDLAERKEVMAELSDGFISLPGGVGTLDEMFEVFTWDVLDVHDKPHLLVDLNGYYQGLLTFLERVVSEGFLGPDHLSRLLVAADPAAALDALEADASRRAADVH